MAEDPDYLPELHGRSALSQRLPVIAALMVSFAVAVLLAHALWLRVVVVLATYGLCALVLRFVLGLSWRRILTNKDDLKR